MARRAPAPNACRCGDEDSPGNGTPRSPRPWPPPLPSRSCSREEGWRATAVYTHHEIEQLISGQRKPEDRRVLYALKALAGLRHGEAAELTSSCYDTIQKPFAAIRLERTRPRCRARFRADLDLLKLRQRHGQNLRRTFVTLAQVDGTRRDLLEAMTHGSRGDTISVCTTFPCPALFAEVAKLEIARRAGASRRRERRVCYYACCRAKGGESLVKTCDPTGNAAKVRLEVPVPLVARGA
jgi:hypothetical protein